MRLDELEAIPGPGGLTCHPVRLTLGVRAFGCNAYTAGEAAQDVVEPHTEDPGSSSIPKRRCSVTTSRGLNAVEGRRGEALEALAEAIRTRPEMADWAGEDDDLESLRDDPAFRKLIRFG